MNENIPQSHYSSPKMPRPKAFFGTYAVAFLLFLVLLGIAYLTYKYYNLNKEIADLTIKSEAYQQASDKGFINQNGENLNKSIQSDPNALSIKLNDSSGLSSFVIENSIGNNVANINSLGNLELEGKINCSNCITLGSETLGGYVKSLTAGDGIAILNGSGEGANAIIVNDSNLNSIMARGASTNYSLTFADSSAGIYFNNLGRLYDSGGNLFYNSVNLTSGSSLPAGTTGHTLRYNGLSWVDSSSIYNDGANIGIGTIAPTELLDVEGDAIANKLISRDIRNGLNIESANSDIVEVAGYDAIGTGAVNWGGGTTERHFLNNYQKSRIRQNGTMTRVGFYLASKPAQITNFYIEVWRKDGSTWDRISQEDVWSQTTAGTINYINLASPVTVREGDYIGYGWASSSTPGNFLTAITGSGSASYYITDASYTTTDFNWAAGTTNTSFLPIKAYMQAPVMAFIGDSIIAGHPGHYSFIEATSTTNIESTIEWNLGNDLDYTYQDMGIGSQTTTQIAARFNNDIVNLKPKIAVLEGGVNDIAGSVPKATFINNWTTVLEACENNNIIPVVVLIMPWTNGSTARMQTRDEWNGDLRTLAESYNAIIVDTSTYVGQYRSGGDAGNLWDIRPAYNADGVHFNAAGHTRIAQAIADAIAKTYVKGGMEVGTMLMRGTLDFSGGTGDKYLTVQRNPGYEQAGAGLRISGGGSTILSTNKNGGDVYVIGGTSTGTGTSNIYFQTATAGSSGTVDNSPTTKLTIGGDGTITTSGKVTVGDDLEIAGSNVTYISATDSIEAAVDSATAGDTIVLAAGTYTITDDIDITKAINIVGQGPGATIINCATDAKNMFHITSDHVRVSNFSMTQSAASGSNYSIYVVGTVGAVFTDIRISDIKISVSGAASFYAIQTFDSSGFIDNVEITGSANIIAGMRIQNNATAEAPTTWYINNTRVEATALTSTGIGLYAWDSSATEDIIVNVNNSKFVITDAGGGTTSGAVSQGSDSYIYATDSVFSGGDYDVNISSSGVFTATNCTLVNNKVNGTISYTGTQHINNGYFAGNVGIGTSSPSYALDVVKTIKAGTALYGNTRVLDFDGNDDNVNIGNISELNSTASFTMTAWVKQDVVPDSGNIFYKYVSSSQRILVQTSVASGVIGIWINNGSSTNNALLSSYNNFITAGRWHHLAVVYDGAGVTDTDKIKLYIDNIPMSLTYTGTTPATTANLAAANANIGYTSSSWDGQIQDFRIYSSSLSASNIATIYQGGTYTTNMVHQYKLMEGSGITATDTGSNVLNGTISGATWSTTGNVGIQTDFGRGALTLAPNTTNAKDGLWFGYDVNMYRSAASVLTSDSKINPASLNIQVKAGVPSDSDIIGVAEDGDIVLDSSDNRIYVRSGGAWMYSALAAGFQIPTHEVFSYDFENKSFDTSRPMQEGDLLIPFAEKSMSDGAMHGLYARFTDVKDLMFASFMTDFERKADEYLAKQNNEVIISNLADLSLSGALNVEGNVKFGGHITVSNDTAGKIVIPAGESKAVVEFKNYYSKPPVVTITPINNQVPYKLISVNENSFLIELSEQSDADLEFNWIALEPN